jgi:glycosyltransferase involved in cell wall biosynthesis
MKVAIFHSTLPEKGRKPGGVEVAVHRLANALVEYEGIAVTVLSCGSAPIDARYGHARVPFFKWLGTHFGRLTALPLVLNFMSFRGFDILHLHGDDWFFLNRQIPTVRTLHGSARMEARFAGTFRRRILHWSLYPLEHASALLATCALAVGPEARAIYGAQHLADNGVDLEVFSPRPKHSEPLLFYIGTWRGRKRGEFAFNTFIAHVLPAFPNAQLYMASDYAPDHDNVIRGGFPQDAELAEWMAQSWVFMYPSLYEGFGIPYLEALASGTAVVATKNSGAEYVLEQGRFGLICDDADFGPSIVAVLKNRAKRTALEIEGRKHAQKYSWRVVAAKHSEIYRSLLCQQYKRRVAA